MVEQRSPKPTVESSSLSAPATSEDFSNFKTLKKLSQNYCIYLILREGDADKILDTFANTNQI